MPPPEHPTIETERLILRPLAIGDFAAYVEFWQDAAVVRFITGAAIPREHIWKRLLATAGHWHLLGFGFFAIEEKASGAFIGEAGFQEMQRDLWPSISGSLEAGWGLLPAYHGRRYASEAMGAAMAWADAAFPALSFSCIISPENVPSLRLAAQLGFVADTVTSYHAEPVVILRKTRESSALAGADRGR